MGALNNRAIICFKKISQWLHANALWSFESAYSLAEGTMKHYTAPNVLFALGSSAIFLFPEKNDEKNISHSRLWWNFGRPNSDLGFCHKNFVALMHWNFHLDMQITFWEVGAIHQVLTCTTVCQHLPHFVWMGSKILIWKERTPSLQLYLRTLKLQRMGIDEYTDVDSRVLFRPVCCCASACPFLEAQCAHICRSDSLNWAATMSKRFWKLSGYNPHTRWHRIPYFALLSQPPEQLQRGSCLIDEGQAWIKVQNVIL